MLQYCFCFLFWWWGMENLNSPTRGWTGIPCIGRWALNHWTAREVPGKLFKNSVAWIPATDCAYVHAQPCPALLRPHGLQPTWLLCPWDFPGQEYWSVLPFPPPRDLLDPGIKAVPLAWQVDSLPLSHWRTPKSDLIVDVVGLLSHVRLFGTPWTAAHQTPLSFTSPGVCSQSHLYHSGACLHIRLDWLDSTFWWYNHVK